MDSVQTNLFGAHLHKLDPKNRISMPAEWRSEENCTLLLLASKRLGYPTIKIYAKDDFLELIANIKANPRYSVAQKDLLIGRMYASCVEASINSQGKLLVPKAMCTHANLTSMVNFVSRGSYIELWEPEAYEEVSRLEYQNIAEINEEYGIF